MASLQIDVVHAQLLQADIQRSRDVSNVGQDLGHDVELLAGNARLLDGSTQLRLSLVHFGTIEVVVAEADGRFGAVDACLVKLGLVSCLVPGGAGAVA